MDLDAVVTVCDTTVSLVKERNVFACMPCGKVKDIEDSEVARVAAVALPVGLVLVSAVEVVAVVLDLGTDLRGHYRYRLARCQGADAVPHRERRQGGFGPDLCPVPALGSGKEVRHHQGRLLD